MKSNSFAITLIVLLIVSYVPTVFSEGNPKLSKDDRAAKARQVYQEASFYYDQGNYLKAMEFYEKAAELFPKYAFPYVGIGHVMIKHRRYEEALVNFQKAIYIKPDFDDAHINLAITYNSLGLYDDAIEELEEAFRLNPNKPNTHKALGDAYQGLGDFDQAVRSYEKAVELNPRYTNAFLGLGDSYFDQKRYQLAVTEYEKALSVNPDDEFIYHRLTASHLKLAQFKNVKRVYRTLFLLYIEKKEYWKAFQMLGSIANADFERALFFLSGKSKHAFLETSLEKEYEELLSKAKFEYEMNRYESAIANYIKALRIKPDSEEILIQLGVCYSMLGVEDLAVESFQRALDLNPDSEQAFIELGGSLQNLQKFKEAIAVYNKALSLNPNSYDAYANLGFLYASLGQLGGAKSNFRKAKELLRTLSGDPIQIRLVSGWLYKLEHVE